MCDCCQTSAAMSAAGPIIVYRDRSSEEIRDIYVTRYANGDWTPPVAITMISGKLLAVRERAFCSGAGHFVAVGWFTAKDDSPKVQLALSTDSGNTFRHPYWYQVPTPSAALTHNSCQRAGCSELADTTDETAELTVSRFSGWIID